MDYSLFKGRRRRLASMLSVGQKRVENAALLLFADFEQERSVFRQESSFYYLTGVTEPGLVLLSKTDGSDTLYLPNYGGAREQWLTTTIDTTDAYADTYKVDAIKHSGQKLRGYSSSPYAEKNEFQNILADLEAFLAQGGIVYTLLDRCSGRYLPQHHCVETFCSWLPSLRDKLRDASPVLHELRRTKDAIELSTIHKAVWITEKAHEVAAATIKEGIFERDLQAQIEHVYTVMGAINAFPSIVATGKNTTVLHYMDRNQKLKNGDLVLIDIGAEYGYYAADLTRTYPVSGTFTPRQKEIYDIVLAAQAYIESVAKPGMYLRNADMPELSLQHLAKMFIENVGYGKYFVHGIGHFLGLDVHDTGDFSRPLVAGDVITIEPGIYIRDESIGVRIEDNYVITDNGCACLSMNLPRTTQEVEAVMAAGRKK